MDKKEKQFGNTCLPLISHFAMRYPVHATNHKRTYKNAVLTTLENRNCEKKEKEQKFPI